LHARRRYDRRRSTLPFTVLIEIVSPRIQLADVFNGFSAAGNNFFAVKATFWMPVK